MQRKAILVGVNVNNPQAFFEYSMQELGELAIACNIQVVGEITQNLNRVNQAYYIGTGKTDELLQMIKEQEADTVIFDDELSPSQIRNLESMLECQVIDRTMLILDIFAERAKTKESQLQVELAQLKYLLPRLVGMRQSLSRQGGGAGFKNRGEGETKLELDRRKIEQRIAVLNKELEQIVSQRSTQRKQRSKNEIPVVSLVGYTNAGKSTIMNAMVDRFHEVHDKQVFEKNMLFATLETAVRRITLDNNKTFLLTDTVGFIHKLPHHLIKAFRSTLEEVTSADLLIHVIDYSNPFHEDQKILTNEILRKIGAENIPMVYAYNKADNTECKIPLVQNNDLFLSAKKRIGLEELTHLITQHIFDDTIKCELLIPFTEGHIVSFFIEHSHVLATEYENEGTRLIVECRGSEADFYQKYVIKRY